MRRIGTKAPLRRMVLAAAAAALLALGPAGSTAAASPRQAAGQGQVGKASYYGRDLHGRRMANGQRFDAGSDAAAHRTLPLGTRARVTNLENGRSATVRVADRGPRVRSRIIDVSPRTAEQLDMKKAGTAPVRVTPLEVPDRPRGKARSEARSPRPRR